VAAAANARREPRRARVLSGMRPTGPLHIGHYFGALANWVRMQQEYDCFFFVADWHALTTHYADTSQVARNTFEVAADWLSVGLDPAKCTIFVQSRILEHAELHLLLSMITPLSWLERVPTYKEQIEQLREKDLGTYGFLGYPLLQSADIVMYGAAKTGLMVPVGEDQVPHIELTREIARRFNTIFGLGIKESLFAPENQAALESVLSGVYLTHVVRVIPGGEVPSLYGSLIRRHVAEVGVENFFARIQKQKRFFSSRKVLHEPQAMLTETPRVPGLDGRRMAKSYGNAIWLSDPPEEIHAKVRGMMTDPQRVRRTDPGRPEVCPVFAWHRLFSEPATIARVDRECRSAEIGCVDCKSLMAEGLVRWIEPIQARRREYEANPAKVWELLEDGSKRAQKAARQTMRRVREAIFGGAARPKAGSRAAARQAATSLAMKARPEGS
jgi:tryptophanyl-tRNA synthetase